jgi:hypothetical protein
MAAQKKIGSVIAILTLLLNPTQCAKVAGRDYPTFCGGSRVGLLALVFLAGDTPASTARLQFTLR